LAANNTDQVRIARLLLRQHDLGRQVVLQGHAGCVQSILAMTSNLPINAGDPGLIYVLHATVRMTIILCASVDCKSRLPSRLRAYDIATLQSTVSRCTIVSIDSLIDLPSCIRVITARVCLAGTRCFCWRCVEMCDVLPIPQRLECGWPTIPEDECVDQRGCCYDNSTVDVIWCFKLPDGKQWYKIIVRPYLHGATKFMHSVLGNYCS
jgi:hypothetical protein